MDPQQSALIEEKLQATWSPEQIVERLRQEGQAVVCFKTIYRRLYAGLLSKGALTVLRHKGKWHKPVETRGKFAVGKTLSQRPKEGRSRETFGHWELDTVVSGRGKSKGRVATFIEWKTRMPDRTALSMQIAFGVAAAQYPVKAFLSATARGKEFGATGTWRPFMAYRCTLRIPIPWQRGSNETANGLWREFFPKGPISPRSWMRIWKNASTSLTTDPKNVWGGELLTNPLQKNCRT